MSNSIYPCLWFDGNAKEAATFYCSAFSNAKITADTPMVVKFEIEGQMIMGLNGGPMYKINPSISFLVNCETTEETENLWNKLIEGGSAMMPLDKYPWSEKYGWLVDKYGMTWQLMLGDLPKDGQKITPSLLFVGEQYGKAEQAIHHYTSILPGSAIHSIQLYKAGEAQPEGKLMFGQFSLTNKNFSAMDGFGNHEFQFNEGVSFVVECDTQDEIDKYWNKLTEGGKEVQCGWLKDKFGVSWQIVPTILSSLMKDPVKSGKIMEAFMQMKKFDIETLVKASNS
jgi:predicted 3-demethylubiquinone-9 3-methyltransferase (glyoxalase superfamily)